jgi:hypothetical protein
MKMKVIAQGNVDNFMDRLLETVSEFQGQGYNVDIQYSFAVTADFNHIYSALIIAKYEV